jgi:hypothetical protein
MPSLRKLAGSILDLVPSSNILAGVYISNKSMRCFRVCSELPYCLRDVFIPDTVFYCMLCLLWELNEQNVLHIYDHNTTSHFVYQYIPVAFISHTSMVKKKCLYYLISCFLFCIFCVSPFFSFFISDKNLFIILYIVFYYCWRMYYCNYWLCGEDPCKLL